MSLIEIDGREGGGPLLRAALTLSLCTGQPFRLRPFRPNAQRPGFTREHAACIQAAALFGQARAIGADVGSTDLTFEPGEVVAGDHTVGVGGGGNCLFVLQTVWPALMDLPAPSRLALRGGTHTPQSPPYHFVERAFAPLMARLGSVASLRLRRHGFEATGGGGVEFTLEGAAAPVQPFDLLDRGPRLDAWADCLIAAVPRHVAARELEAVGRSLGWGVERLHTPSVRQNEGPGNALMVTLSHGHVTNVFTAIGQKGVSAEMVARAVIREVRHHEASVSALGANLADQWLLPLAIAVWRRGRAGAFTCTGVNAPARTHIEVVQRFLPVGVDVAPDAGGWRVDIRP